MGRWFRLDNDVVNDPKVQSLPDVLFRACVNVLCVASKHDGKLPPLRDTAFILRITEAKAAELLTKLCAAGLLDKDGGTFVPHNWDKRQFKSDEDATAASRSKKYRDKKRDDTVTVTRDASRDTTVSHERPHTHTQTHTEYSEANASGADAPPDPSIAEREYFARGRELLGKSAGGQLAKLKTVKGGNIALARAALETASTKDNPSEYIAGAIRSGAGLPVRAMTVAQQNTQETKEILNGLSDFSTRGGGSGETYFGILPIHSGERSKELRGGFGGAVIDVSSASHIEGS
jgi:hypothetical protein